MDYISRSEWGARPPTQRSTISHSEGVFVHYTGVDQDQSMRTLQDFHMNTRGWYDIAYSWVVYPDGRIYEGRGWGVSGAHTENWNSRSHGVCAVLGPGEIPTQDMLDSIAVVIKEHNHRYGTGFVRPHHAVNSTSCPGGPLTRWINNEKWKIDQWATRQFWERLARAVTIADRTMTWNQKRRIKHYQNRLGMPLFRRTGRLDKRTLRRIAAFQTYMGLTRKPYFTRETRIWLEYSRLG